MELRPPHLRNALPLFTLTLCACLSGVLNGCSEATVPAKDTGLPHGIRHVIVIAIDTLRADHLGCYGHKYVQSPAIDALAREGVQFMRCTSAAPTTLASHTSLFTGTYPHTHGVPRNGYEVPQANTMLAEVLGEHGFTSAGFVGAAPLDVDVNFHQGFDHYDAQFSQTEGLREGIYQRPAPEVSLAALKWLAEHDLRASERLFLFLHYFDVHSPYTVPSPFGGMYAEQLGAGVQGRTDTSDEGLKAVRADLNKAVRAEGRDSGQGARNEGFLGRLEENGSEAFFAAQRMAAEYAAGVTWTDHHLDSLFAELRERGILEESLVVLTSDHGETLLEHKNLFNHGNTVYQSETHVPLILRFPGQRYASRQVTETVSNIDVMPTVLELLEIRIPDEVEGHGLTPSFSGSGLKRGPVFSEATKPYGKPRFNGDKLWLNQGKYQSATLGAYKYLSRIPDKKFRLYDLDSDPDEQHNLLLDGGEVIEAKHVELKRALDDWRAEAAPLAATRSDSESQRKALNALGYSGSDRER